MKLQISDVINNVEVFGLERSIKTSKYPMATDVSKCTSEITDRTNSLATVRTGTGHDNFLKGIIVEFDLTMTAKMSVEEERYHFIDFISSQSTMHKITKFDLDKSYICYTDERCINVIKELVAEYNELSKEEQNSEYGKELYLRILYSNPCGFRLTSGMVTNYQQLKTIYQQRKNHRLPEWRVFCQWIETLPHSEFIVGGLNNA